VWVWVPNSQKLHKSQILPFKKAAQVGVGVSAGVGVGSQLQKLHKSSILCCKKLHKWAWVWAWVPVPNRKSCTSRQFSLKQAAQVRKPSPTLQNEEEEAEEEQLPQSTLRE